MINMINMITAIAATFFSAQCLANTKAFDVRAKVSVDGKLISSPHFVTKPNEVASVSQNVDGYKKILIEMIASDSLSKEAQNGIMMKFTVSQDDGGKRTVISKPQIVAVPGEKAEIEVGTKDVVESVKIDVVATRIE